MELRGAAFGNDSDDNISVVVVDFAMFQKRARAADSKA
jgi:hypothetical protein